MPQQEDLHVSKSLISPSISLNLELFKNVSILLRYSKKSKALVEKYYKEIELGVRTPYCASIHDEQSIINNYYDKKRAEEVFKYYIDNANQK